jgi:hypothetical protein
LSKRRCSGFGNESHYFAVGLVMLSIAAASLDDQLTANFNGQSFGARIEGGYGYAVLPTLGVTRLVKKLI